MSNKIITIDDTKITLTNLEKKLWSDYSKLDLINYYTDMAEYLLPYLKDRPISMKRYPNGIDGKSFFQKNIGILKRPWMKTEKVQDKDGKITEYLICNDKLTLIYLANLACIEIHPWFSRVSHLNNPDFLLLDLDPEKVPFKDVVKVATVSKKVLDSLRVSCFIKTSGARGLHILIPCGANYSYEQVKDFAEILVRMIHKETPDITSLERLPEKRQNKIYLDWLQNAQGQTMIVPYGTRAKPNAPVSTPLNWEEVGEKLDPKSFNMSNIKARVLKKGDIWKNLYNVKPVDIKGVIENYGKS